MPAKRSDSRSIVAVSTPSGGGNARDHSEPIFVVAWIRLIQSDIARYESGRVMPPGENAWSRSRRAWSYHWTGSSPRWAGRDRTSPTPARHALCCASALASVTRPDTMHDSCSCYRGIRNIGQWMLLNTRSIGGPMADTRRSCANSNAPRRRPASWSTPRWPTTTLELAFIAIFHDLAAMLAPHRTNALGPMGQVANACLSWCHPAQVALFSSPSGSGDLPHTAQRSAASRRVHG